MIQATADSSTLRRPYYSLYLVTFAMTIALVTLEVALHASNYLSAQFFGWIVGLNTTMRRHYNDSAGENAALALWSIALVVPTILLFVLVLKLRTLRRIFRSWSSIVALLAVPLCLISVRRLQPGLYMTDWRLFWPWLETVGIGWLWLETVLAVVCLLLFRFSRWQVSKAVTLGLVVLHCLLWSRAYYVVWSWRQSFSLLIPVLSSVSIILWGLWIRTAER